MRKLVLLALLLFGCPFLPTQADPLGHVPPDAASVSGLTPGMLLGSASFRELYRSINPDSSLLSEFELVGDLGIEPRSIAQAVAFSTIDGRSAIILFGTVDPSLVEDRTKQKGWQEKQYQNARMWEGSDAAIASVGQVWIIGDPQAVRDSIDAKSRGGASQRVRDIAQQRASAVFWNYRRGGFDPPQGPLQFESLRQVTESILSAEGEPEVTLTLELFTPDAQLLSTDLENARTELRTFANPRGALDKFLEKTSITQGTWVVVVRVQTDSDELNSVSEELDTLSRPVE